MSVVSCFKRVLCQSYICLFFVVVVSCHGRLVYYAFGLALSVKWACFVFSAVAFFLCCSSRCVVFVQYCFVVTCYYLLHVGHAAVAEFYCVSVQ